MASGNFHSPFNYAGIVQRYKASLQNILKPSAEEISHAHHSNFNTDLVNSRNQSELVESNGETFKSELKNRERERERDGGKKIPSLYSLLN